MDGDFVGASDGGEGGEGEVDITGAHVDNGVGADGEGADAFRSGAGGGKCASSKSDRGAVVYRACCGDGETGAGIHGDGGRRLKGVGNIQTECATIHNSCAGLGVGFVEDNCAACHDEAAGVGESTGEGDGAGVAGEGGVAIQVVVIKERGGPGTAETDRAGGTAGIGCYIDRGVVRDAIE